MTVEELKQEGVKDEFMNLMKKCNYVKSIDDDTLPTGRNVTYCFPKRYQCCELEEIILERYRNLYDPIIKRAEDFEETRTQVIAGMN